MMFIAACRVSHGYTIIIEIKKQKSEEKNMKFLFIRFIPFARLSSHIHFEFRKTRVWNAGRMSNMNISATNKLCVLSYGIWYMYLLRDCAAPYTCFPFSFHFFFSFRRFFSRVCLCRVKLLLTSAEWCVMVELGWERLKHSLVPFILLPIQRISTNFHRYSSSAIVSGVHEIVDVWWFRCRTKSQVPHDVIIIVVIDVTQTLA